MANQTDEQKQKGEAAMAAIEQIRSFARVAGTPLEIVYQPEQAMEALARLADCEIILIDTAGCTVNETSFRIVWS